MQILIKVLLFIAVFIVVFICSGVVKIKFVRDKGRGLSFKFGEENPDGSKK